MTDIQFKAHAIAMEWLRNHKSAPPMPVSGFPTVLTIESYVRIYRGRICRGIERAGKAF